MAHFPATAMLVDPGVYPWMSRDGSDRITGERIIGLFHRSL